MFLNLSIVEIFILLVIAIITIIVFFIFLNREQTVTEPIPGTTTPPNQTFVVQYVPPLSPTSPICNSECSLVPTETNFQTLLSSGSPPTSYFWDTKVQSTGKIVVCGRNSVARFNIDGSIDTTFGGLPFPGWFDIPDQTGSNSLDIGLDDSIYITTGGSALPSTSFYVTKLTPDGALDLTYGTGGHASVPDSEIDQRAEHVHVFNDGSVLAVQDDRSIIVKFQPDGTLDTTFGAGGLVPGIVELPQFNGEPGTNSWTFGVSSDRIYVQIGSDNEDSLGIICLDMLGVIDTSYGVNGVFSIFNTDLPGAGTCTDIESYGGGISPDGSYYITGWMTKSATEGSCDFIGNNFFVIKVTPSGILDVTFADGGIYVETRPEFATEDVYMESYHDPIFHPCDGSVLITMVVYGDDQYSVLLRLNSSGIPDAVPNVSPIYFYGWSIGKTIDGRVYVVGDDDNGPAIIDFNCSSISE
jgi:uncharacterized delta-60 repeat protein